MEILMLFGQLTEEVLQCFKFFYIPHAKLWTLHLVHWTCDIILNSTDLAVTKCYFYVFCHGPTGFSEAQSNWQLKRTKCGIHKADTMRRGDMLVRKFCENFLELLSFSLKTIHINQPYLWENRQFEHQRGYDTGNKPFQAIQIENE